MILHVDYCILTGSHIVPKPGLPNSGIGTTQGAMGSWVAEGESPREPEVVGLPRERGRPLLSSGKALENRPQLAQWRETRIHLTRLQNAIISSSS